MPQSGISAWDKGIIYGSDMKLKVIRPTVGIVDPQHVKTTTPATQNAISSQSNTTAVNKVTKVMTPLTPLTVLQDENKREEVALRPVSTITTSNDKSSSNHQHVSRDRIIPEDVAKDVRLNENNDEEYDPTSSADNEAENVPEVRTRQPKYSPYLPPSSDPSVEIKYYGHQRVVIKKS